MGALSLSGTRLRTQIRPQRSGQSSLAPCQRCHCLTSQICESLAAVNLAGYEYRPVGALSAGQQRRVALARLLLSDAPLWLLDEPFTALDVAGCEWLEACVRDHVNAGGATVFTSHQPSRFGVLQQDLDLGQYVV
ncbi:MAG: hypothetical protein CM15mP125_1920 [Gammaproteobacteria bacterium]|nr:MAG: hypothetical protein CM15mP125_1920 [Gammaproteobacteria bacterium]